MKTVLVIVVGVCFSFVQTQHPGELYGHVMGDESHMHPLPSHLFFGVDMIKNCDIIFDPRMSRAKLEQTTRDCFDLSRQYGDKVQKLEELMFISEISNVVAGALVVFGILMGHWSWFFPYIILACHLSTHICREVARDHWEFRFAWYRLNALAFESDKLIRRSLLPSECDQLDDKLIRQIRDVLEVAPRIKHKFTNFKFAVTTKTCRNVHDANAKPPNNRKVPSRPHPKKDS
jgi:hypothetical protein